MPIIAQEDFEEYVVPTETPAVDNFESYGDTDPILGGTGGSGWVGAWFWDAFYGGNAGGWFATTSEFVTGSVSIQSSGDNSTIVRELTDKIAHGIIHLFMRSDGVASPPNVHFDVWDGTTLVGAYVIAPDDGGIQYLFDGGSVQLSISASDNVWYEIEVEFDADNQRIRLRRGGNTNPWSAWFTTANLFTGVNFVDLIAGGPSGATVRIDDLSISPAPVPLQGKNGGTGWTSAWYGDTDESWTVIADTPISGAKSAKNDGGFNPNKNVSRDFPVISIDGSSVSFKVVVPSGGTNGDDNGTYILNSEGAITAGIRVITGGGGYILAYGPSGILGEIEDGNIAPDTTYTITFFFDYTNWKYYMQVEGGSATGSLNGPFDLNPFFLGTLHDSKTLQISSKFGNPSPGSAGYVLVDDIIITEAEAGVLSENFDSYSNGLIDGDNGGTGWVGPWLDPDGAYSVQSSIVHSSPHALKGTGDGVRHDLNRHFVSFSADNQIRTFYAYIDGNTSGNWDISLLKFGNPDVAAGVQFRSGDNTLRLISASDGGPWIVIQTFSPGQWYKIDLKLNFTDQTYQVQINDGGFTASYQFWVSSDVVDTFIVIGENPGVGNDLYLDDIRDTTPINTTFQSDGFIEFFITLTGDAGFGEKNKGKK